MLFGGAGGGAAAAGGEGADGEASSSSAKPPPRRRVLLLERDLGQPDRIVGELLQPGGYLKLKQLGLEAAVDGIDAQRVVGYAMFKGGRNATVAYPTEGFSGDVAGRSFHNGRFVQRLREASAAAPGVTVRQGTVRGLVDDEGRPWDDGSASSSSSSSSSPSSSSSARAPPSRPVRGVSYRSACDGQQRVARAHLTIVCDGMYSNLRSKLSTPQIEAPSYFVGLILKGATLPAPSHGHVVLGDPSPVLFYPISSTEVRCLVDVPGDRLPSASTGDLARYLLEVVGPQVPAELRAPFEEAVGAGGVRAMQNKLMAAAPLHTPGALLLGDSFNMRHPLTGGGMTVALGDAALLLGMLQALPSFEDPAATALGSTPRASRCPPRSTRWPTPSTPCSSRPRWSGGGKTAGREKESPTRRTARCATRASTTSLWGGGTRTGPSRCSRACARARRCSSCTSSPSPASAWAG